MNLIERLELIAEDTKVRVGTNHEYYSLREAIDELKNKSVACALEPATDNAVSRAELVKTESAIDNQETTVSKRTAKKRTKNPA